MDSATVSKSQAISPKRIEEKDALWVELKAGFESLKNGKAKEWKHPFK